MIRIFYNDSKKRIRLCRENKKVKKSYYVIDIEQNNPISVIINKFIKGYFGVNMETIITEEYYELKPYEIIFSDSEIKEKLKLINTFLKEYPKCKTPMDLFNEGYRIGDKVDIWFSTRIKNFSISPLKIVFKEIEKQYPDIFK